MKPAVLAPPESFDLSGRHVPHRPGRPVVLDGAVTYLRETPATLPGAEPALYIHGLGGSSTNWTDLAHLLSDRLDGHAIDLPGFGRSDPGRSYSLAASAHRVNRWIEYSGRGPVHLVGNSLGGAISALAAASRPDLVRSLTLISPAMPFLDPRRSEHGRMLPLLVIPKLERLAARQMSRIPPEELSRQVADVCFADPTRMTAQRRAEAVEEAKLRYDIPWYIEAYVRTLRSLVASFLRAYLPGPGSMWRIAARIDVPTLVIGGRMDRLVDPRVAGQVARIVPDSRLLELDGVGHVAQMEVPQVVARAMTALIDEVNGVREREAVAGMAP
jgi:pimeloyl-ACP methyl ester carboxylesterase